MITNSYTFYKTPLDNTYTNVIDFNIDDIFNIVEDSEIALKKYIKENIFDVYYNPLLIESQLKCNKSDLLTLKVVVNKSYDQMRDYNYCIIKTHLSQFPVFYFIRDVVSENDNLSNPSCSIYLDYDVWNNNIYHLLKNDYFGKTTTRHYDRIAGLASGNLYYNHYPIVNTELEHYIFNDYVGDEDEVTKARYKLLFCIYELENFGIPDGIDLGLKYNVRLIDEGLEGDAFTTEVYDYIIPIYNKNLIYIPIGLLDTLNNEFVSCSLVSKGYNMDENFSVLGNEMILSKLVSFPLFPQLTPYTAKIHLSYFSPYNYTVSDLVVDKIVRLDCVTGIMKGTGEYNGSGENKEWVVIGDLPKKFKMIKPNEPAWFEYDVDDFNVYDSYIDEIKNNLYLVKENEYEIDIYKKLDVPTTRNDFLEYEDGVEPQEYSFPFNYLSLSINQNQYPLVLPKPNRHIINISEDYRTFQPRIIITDETGKRLFSPQGFYMSGNGVLSFSIDALDDYLIRNGSQEKISERITEMSAYAKSNASVISFLIGLAGSQSAQGDSSATQYLTSIPETLNQRVYLNMQINAKHKDLSTTPDKYNVGEGENDKLFQDRLQLYRYSVDKDDVNYINVMSNFHIYGYDMIKEENISNVNNRINFDFIKCDYVDLILPISSTYIAILKNIFIRGTFKNHYNYNNGDIIFNHTFNKSIGNKERKFYFDERYKNWLNS